MKLLRQAPRFLFFLLLFSFIFPSSVLAQSAWSGNCVMPGNPDVATIQGLECLFKNVLQVIVSAAGIVFLVMFTYGGFQYLVSSNDQKKVAQANSTLTLAFFGLVGVIISWLVLRFIQQFTGVNVTDFKIPGP